jgi:hypothetical protein
MSTTEPTTEAGKLRARIEKDAQEINARANHFESLRVVNALAAFGLDACQAGIEATGRLTEAEAALSQLAMASNDGWARCDKCGQKLASDEDDDEPYCLNCETCSRCQGIHHMEDRCQDATDAEAALSQRDAELATVVEALRDVLTERGETFLDEMHVIAIKRVLANLSTAATEHDERIRQAERERLHIVSENVLDIAFAAAVGAHLDHGGTPFSSLLGCERVICRDRGERLANWYAAFEVEARPDDAYALPDLNSGPSALPPLCDRCGKGHDIGNPCVALTEKPQEPK